MSVKATERGIEVEDVLLGLKDIQNYDEPNFVEFKDGEPRLYVVRCYECPDAGSRGRENYIPNVSLGVCTWCGWRPDPKIVEEIMKNKMITQGLPAKSGMTLDEIRSRYPKAYQAAIDMLKEEK